MHCLAVPKEKKVCIPDAYFIEAQSESHPTTPMLAEDVGARRKVRLTHKSA
jgi:hypothetical protein